MKQSKFIPYHFWENLSVKAVYYAGGAIGRVQRIDGKGYKAIDRSGFAIGTYYDPESARQAVETDYMYASALSR